MFARQGTSSRHSIAARSGPSLTLRRGGGPIVRDEMYARRLSRSAVAFLLGATSVVGLVIGAVESNAVTCAIGPRNTVDKEAIYGPGNRVQSPGMKVFDADISCARVSSLFVGTFDNSSFVEVGWYEDPPDPGWDFVCIGNSSVLPRELAFAYNSGLVSCLASGASVPPGQDAFTVSDANLDEVWTFGHGGSVFWTSPEMGFASGLLTTNGERESNNFDTAKSEFDGLQRMTLSGSWIPWQDASEYQAASNDPGFKDCIDADDHIRVIKEEASC